MDTNEMRDAILQLPEDQRRDLIKELIPEFIGQIRSDSILRGQCMAMLRDRAVSQGQVIFSAAKERAVTTSRAILGKFLAVSRLAKA